MNKQLGTRCPECGTETAPQVILAITPHTETQWIAVCPRCGHQAFAELVVHALEDFYSPQFIASIPSPFGVVPPSPALGVVPGSGEVSARCEACYGTGRYGDNGSLVRPVCH